MELQIAKIISNGYGIGWADGKTYFVPFVIPGEKVLVTESIMEKGHFLVKSFEILERSPFRREPACENFTRCGGCSFLHIEYSRQLQIKKEIFNELLHQNGLPSINDVEILTPGEFGIRTRAKVLIRNGLPAYMAYRSNTPVFFKNCPLLHPELMKGILENAKGLTGEIQFEYSAVTKELMPVQDSMFKVVSGEKLKLLKNSFFQSSEEGAGILAGLVLEEAGGNVRTAYDLFCGGGLFSYFLAKKGILVTGVEVVPDACRSFNENLKESAKLIRIDAYRLKKLDKADLIVADPPREGLGKELIKVICDSGTEKVIYISCEPSKFARDLRKFNESGYNLSKIKLIDLFPGTPHFEVFAVLENRT